MRWSSWPSKANRRWRRILWLAWPRRLRGWSKAPQPAAWSSAASKLAADGSAELKQHVQELGVVFGDGRAIDELRAMVADGDADPNARRQALRAMLISRPANMAGSLQDLTADRVMAIEAIRGLALYDDPHTPGACSRTGTCSGRPSGPKRSTRFAPARHTPGRCSTWCARRRSPRATSRRFTPGRSSEFNDPELTKQLAEVWGEVRSVDRGETRVDRPLQVGDHARHIDAGPARSGPRAFPEELRQLSRAVRRGPQGGARSDRLEPQEPGLPARKRHRSQRQRRRRFSQLGSWLSTMAACSTA